MRGGGLVRGFATAILIAAAFIAPAAFAADGEPPEEPVRGGPVLTIPVSTDNEAFAMVLVGAIAPQPTATPGDALHIELQFAGSAIDGEVCVALEGIGCVGVLPVAADGSVDGAVDLPDDLTAGTYVVTIESPTLGVVALGETRIRGETAAEAPPTATSSVPPVEPDEEQTADPAPASIISETSDDEGVWAILIGAIGVILIGLIGIRDRRRYGRTEHSADRLSHLELPTATQLPDRTTERKGTVAVLTRRSEPGEGFVVVALERDETGVDERTVSRHSDLDEAMEAAREEARNHRTGVMWWEVRRHGSTLPVWIIEGDVTPVTTDGAGTPDSQ